MSNKAPKTEKKRVKLTRPCHVGGEERKAGDIVEVLPHTAAWLIQTGAAAEARNPA